MRLQVATIFASSLLIIVLSNQVDSSSQERSTGVSNYKSTTYKPKTIGLSNNDKELGKSEFKKLVFPNPRKLNSELNTIMTLTSTGEVNSMNNPIYALTLFVNGELIKTYPVVTGRNFTQNRDRHRSGTEAPLPDGNYQVANRPIPGTHVEVGNLFLPITPLFRTNRTYLGIHYDPSFEKNNGQDGTAGCIALTNEGDLNEVLQYVQIYQPRYLRVTTQSPIVQTEI